MQFSNNLENQNFDLKVIFLDKANLSEFFKERIENKDLTEGEIGIFYNLENSKVLAAILLKDDNYAKAGEKLAKLLKNKTYQNININFNTDNELLIKKFLYNLISELFDYKKNQDFSFYLSLKEEFLNELKAFKEGIFLLKKLGDSPANLCTPAYFANQAKNLKTEKLKIKVLDKFMLEQEKMGGILAVAKGSAEPPALVIAQYFGAEDREEKPIVLIGKGVCFDSGGISIKPSAEMDLMKYDMLGAATVLGLIKAIELAQLPINLVGLMPLVENLPSCEAIKPSDVIYGYSGKSIEVLNTDAEGRLILSDALSFAQRFNPKEIIDIATLTGACVIALGSTRAAIIANDENLAKNLFKAGEEIGDKFWQLPLDLEYREKLNSNFADIANITGNREAGTISAAVFLNEFVPPNTAWAHLDIAGVAWKRGGDKGATGRPFLALFNYLSS